MLQSSALRRALSGGRGRVLPWLFVALLVIHAPPAPAQTQETGGIGGTGVSSGDRGGIGGTGVNGEETGGIGGTGVRDGAIVGYGPIQRFGSVFVNGREYGFDAHTSVTVDGRPAPIAALRIGDMALVQGIVTGPKSGVARMIAVWQSIVGPVATVASDARSFTVLGQRVQLSDASVTVRPGDIVGVSGQRQADGTWVASRVIALPPTRTFRLETTVTAIGGDSVRFQGLVLRAAPALLTGIRAGDRVVATGTLSDGAPRLHTLTPRPLQLGAPGTRVEAQGYFRPAGDGRLVSPDGMVVVGAPVSHLSGVYPAEIVGELDAEGAIEFDAVRVAVPVLPTDEVAPMEPRAEIENPAIGGQHAAETAGHASDAASSVGAEPPEINEPQEVSEPEVEPPEIEVPEPQSPEPDIDAPEVEPPNER